MFIVKFVVIFLYTCSFLSSYIFFYGPSICMILGQIVLAKEAEQILARSVLVMKEQECVVNLKICLSERLAISQIFVPPRFGCSLLF